MMTSLPCSNISRRRLDKLSLKANVVQGNSAIDLQCRTWTFIQSCWKFSSLIPEASSRSVALNVSLMYRARPPPDLCSPRYW